MTDLNTKLEKEANIMLREYLKRWRKERRSGNLASLGLIRPSSATMSDLDRVSS